jgi:hypothetical protein
MSASPFQRSPPQHRLRRALRALTLPPIPRFVSQYNPARMQVEISRDRNCSKIDHLFVLLAEGKSTPNCRRRCGSDPRVEVRGARRRRCSRFSPAAAQGDADRVREARRPHAARRARGITTAGRTAKKHRDAKIALLFPYTLPRMNADETALIVADILAQSDYKYDPFITVKKDRSASPSPPPSSRRTPTRSGSLRKHARSPKP